MDKRSFFWEKKGEKKSLSNYQKEAHPILTAQREEKGEGEKPEKTNSPCATASSLSCRASRDQQALSLAKSSIFALFFNGPRLSSLSGCLYHQCYTSVPLPPDVLLHHRRAHGGSAKSYRTRIPRVHLGT